MHPSIIWQNALWSHKGGLVMFASIWHKKYMFCSLPLIEYYIKPCFYLVMVILPIADHWLPQRRRLYHCDASKTTIPSKMRGPTSASTMQSQPQDQAVLPFYHVEDRMPSFYPFCSSLPPFCRSFYPNSTPSAHNWVKSSLCFTPSSSRSWLLPTKIFTSIFSILGACTL